MKETKEMKDRLTEMRKRAKLSQQDLADKLFVSRSTVSRWENGELTPSIVNLKEMAKLYGVSLDYLCGNDEPTQQKPEEQPSIEMVEPSDADSTRHQRWWDIKKVIIAVVIFGALVLGGLWIAQPHGESTQGTGIIPMDDMREDQSQSAEEGSFDFEW